MLNKRLQNFLALGKIMLLCLSGSIFLSSVSAQEAIRTDGAVAAGVPGAPQSIAFWSTRDGNNEIYVMNPDGSMQNRKTTTAPTVTDIRPDISPDGSEIVFSSNRDGNIEIFVMNFDGTGIRQLTFTAAPIANHWPRWSPDGQWIAFQSGTNADTQIYRIGRDGNGLTQVTNHPGINQYPGWSPDGNRLAIRRDNDIYLINSTDGGEPVRLTNVGTTNQMASFSPDGTRIAFFTNREGYGSVFVMNSDGSGEQVNFTPRPPGYPGTWGSRAPSWSPNGEFIYFTATRSVENTNTNEQIYVKPAAGGDETRLTSAIGAGVNAEASVRRIVAPTITSLVATPDILWPTINRYVEVSLTVGVIDYSDPAPVCEITAVTSNEAPLQPAWVITGPLTLDLLAQRFGRGRGRVYTITVTCTNTSDLSSSGTVTVTVPHDQGNSVGTDSADVGDRTTISPE